MATLLHSRVSSKSSSPAVARTAKSPANKATNPRKPARAAPTAKRAAPSPEAMAALYAALAKVAGKEGNRDALPAGASYNANLAILGEVNGERVSVEFFADLEVGHDSTRASSVTPDASHVVAYLLGLMNAATRAKALRELPERFAANGDKLPEVEPKMIDAAENMLGRLRAKVLQPVRGSVAGKYRMIGPGFDAE